MHAQAWCANPDDTGDSNLKIRAWRRHFADRQITDYVDRATKELDGKKQVAIYVNLQRKIWVHGPLVTPIAALHGM